MSLIFSLWPISRRNELQMEFFPWQAIFEVLSVVPLMLNKG